MPTALRTIAEPPTGWSLGSRLDPQGPQGPREAPGCAAPGCNKLMQQTEVRLHFESLGNVT